MATIGALLSGSLNGGSEKEKAVSGDSGTPSTAGGCGLHLVTEELIRKGIDSLEDPEQKVSFFKTSGLGFWVWI